MKLTIEQALRQGVAAQKEGKLHDAERLYRAILKSQPNHPDVNHNLGVIAIRVNKADAAVPLFKTALEARPKVDQFWMSYIDALIKTERFDDARLVLANAQHAGVTAEKLQTFIEQLQSKPSPIDDRPEQEMADLRQSNLIALSAAIKLREIGNYTEAQEWLSNLIENDPNNAEAISLLSHVLLLANKEVEAEKALTKAASINSELPSIYRNQARLLLKQSETEGALRKAQLGYQKAPENLEGLLVLAACLAANRRDLEALPIIEKILKADSDYAEAYANRALIKLRARDSVGAIEDAKITVSLKPHLTQTWVLLSSLHYQDHNLSEAIHALKNAHKNEPQNPDFMVKLGEYLRQANKPSEAITFLRQATKLSPKNANAWTNLGVTFQQEKRVEDAKIAYEKALTLNPKSAAITNNLGAIAKDAEEWETAVRYFTKALKLQPSLAEPYNNLGATLKELGKLKEAEESYAQAIALRPDFAEAHSNLGTTLNALGRVEEAIESYAQAVMLKPEFDEAYVNLGISLKNVRFSSTNPKLYPPIIQLLTAGNFVRPRDVAKSILSLLKHDFRIKDLLLEKNHAASLNEATAIIESLDTLPLLHHLMRICPLPELQFEKFFVAMRSLLLKNLERMKESRELTFFLTTLSIQCFINEYIYIESDEESRLIDKLQAKISQAVALSTQPENIEILCLAAYRPLHNYDWCRKLGSIAKFEEVKRRLIEEPLQEKLIAKDIPMLGEISDNVSLKVRGQYEENPYPRWVSPGVSLKAKTIADVCDELELRLHFEDIRSVTAPLILIAGCGTGQQSVGTASRFSNCSVTAVDLSRASLAYAKRKSIELRLNNIDYLQADILNLHHMDEKFDIIESTGVLHHMNQPTLGWRVLVNLVKPGGLMRIGLYSELARQHVTNIRRKIAALGIGESEAEMKIFRQSLAESHDENDRRLATSSDFFSLSAMRDLIFHVHEHHYNLPQIEKCLDALGLKFSGFENADLISKFRGRFGNEVDIYDLSQWHQFEERFPNTFAGMYQFWCQKRLD